MLARLYSFAMLLLLIGVVGGVYAPYASNPVVFDDHNILTNLAVYDYAQEVFSRYTRTFPYFTIGFAHILSGGDLAWNRYLSIALHCFVVLALYFFLLRALSRAQGLDASAKRWVAIFVCLWVSLNPVAVYAVGYLIQRTIVLAALFAVLSANLYLRGQQKERNVDLMSAALCAGLSVMCKEHSVLLPLAVVVLTPLVCDWSKRTVTRALGYLLLSLPVAVWAFLNRGTGILGASYEIYSGQVMSQVGGADFPGGVWLMSIATQLLLFWKYIFLWFVPNPQWMSADMRVDFQSLWSGWRGYVGLTMSVAVFLTAGMFWLKTKGRNLFGPISAAVLFTAIPFLVELSVVRVQEPFVLYRSYLWMPGYALFFCLLLARSQFLLARQGVMALRVYWVGLMIACAALFPMAQDRLRSFSSEEALWQDAQRKLPRPDVAGADRIYYNLAGEAFKRKDYVEALRYSEMVIAQNPGAFQGYLAKGTSLLALHEFGAAAIALDEAEAHQPPPKFLGYIEFKRCNVIEARGRREDVIACLRRSAKMGYEMARFRLEMAGIPIEN